MLHLCSYTTMYLAIHTETSNCPFSHRSLVCRQKRLRKFVSPWHSSTEKARGGWEKGGPAVEQVFKYGKGESGGTTDPGAAVHLHSHLTSREQVRYSACLQATEMLGMLHFNCRKVNKEVFHFSPLMLCNYSVNSLRVQYSRAKLDSLKMKKIKYKRKGWLI